MRFRSLLKFSDTSVWDQAFWFFTNAELLELPATARLLFLGLLGIADREGRLNGKGGGTGANHHKRAAGSR